MNELFHITPHQEGNGFDMELHEGDIVIPDEPRCYVASTGCGSGKTESIKSLIRQKYDEGIVYCVDTKVELEKMYDWILANLCNRPDINMRDTDVFILSSEGKYRDCLDAYKNEPELIMQKKIILLTHVRFWTDLINYFLIYRPQEKVEAFDCDFEALMSRNDLRKYILFDETPSFIRPFFSLPKSILGCFSMYSDDGRWVCRSPIEMMRYYLTFIAGTPEDPFPKEKTKLNKIKKLVVFKMIPKLYNQWLATKGSMDITFRPADLSQPNINTHVIIMEGAGDVLFQHSPFYEVVDLPDKYNTSVVFNPIPFPFKRRDKELDKVELDSFLKLLRRHLLHEQRQGRKNLIVVWKNYGEAAYSDDSGFYNLVKEKLSKDRRLRKDSYKVIYYGSSDSKSTNEYRDFDGMILCGTWHIPNNETAKFQTSYGVDTSNRDHALWAYIQLLCRIGIRRHDNQTYQVWYSNDYSQGFIDRLSDYFNNNRLIQRRIDVERVPEWLENRIGRTNIGKKKDFTDELCRLIEYDANIQEAIKVERQYHINIPLDDLYRIIPRHCKKRARYATLCENLQRLGLTLNIT